MHNSSEGCDCETERQIADFVRAIEQALVSRDRVEVVCSSAIWVDAGCSHSEGEADDDRQG